MRGEKWAIMENENSFSYVMKEWVQVSHVSEFLKYSTYITCHWAWIKITQVISIYKSIVYLAIFCRSQLQNTFPFRVLKPLFLKFPIIPFFNMKKPWVVLHDCAWGSLRLVELLNINLMYFTRHSIKLFTGVTEEIILQCVRKSISFGLVNIYNMQKRLF